MARAGPVVHKPRIVTPRRNVQERSNSDSCSGKIYQLQRQRVLIRSGYSSSRCDVWDRTYAKLIERRWQKWQFIAEVNNFTMNVEKSEQQ